MNERLNFKSAGMVPRRPRVVTNYVFLMRLFLRLALIGFFLFAMLMAMAFWLGVIIP